MEKEDAKYLKAYIKVCTFLFSTKKIMFNKISFKTTYKKNRKSWAKLAYKNLGEGKGRGGRETFRILLGTAELPLGLHSCNDPIRVMLINMILSKEKNSVRWKVHPCIFISVYSYRNWRWILFSYRLFSWWRVGGIKVHHLYATYPLSSL